MRTLVLGIDPGYDRCGYGILEFEAAKGIDMLTNLEVVDYGLISTDPTVSFSERLSELGNGINNLLLKHNIDKAIVEKYFFSPRRKQAVEIAEARGVILYVLNENGIDIVEYSPSHIKRVVANCGRASKKEVEKRVMIHLGLTEKPKPDDVVDALAIALCYAFDVEKNL